MRRSCFRCVVPAVLGSVLAGFAQPAAISPVVISNVTVVDVMTGQLRKDVTVVIENERIAAVGHGVAIPRGATRLNGRGKFLIPGLWDMHSHHQGTGAQAVDLFVAKGVVGTRDMGGDLDFILPLRERVRSGAVLGPEIVAAGPILDDAPPSYPYRQRVSSAQQAREAVADLKRAGVDFVKVHDHTPREVFFAIASEAPKLGLPFAGHVPQGVKVEEAAEAGMRSIEHLSNYEVFGECIVGDDYSFAGCRRLFEKLAAKGVWQTPTLAFFQTIPDVFSGKPLAHAEYASDSLLKLTRDNVEISKVPARALEKLRLAADVTVRQVLRDLHATGNQFLAGCDGLVPGFCLHDELEWFVKGGLSPLDALRTATINPARFLGREKTQGAVEVGKRADLVLLDANPLEEIRNVGRVDSVVLRGKLVRKNEVETIVAGHRRRE
ncbi:MAG: amidohydrolase family protein [Bryobacteraceae bacterium]